MLTYLRRGNFLCLFPECAHTQSGCKHWKTHAENEALPVQTTKGVSLVVQRKKRPMTGRLFGGRSFFRMYAR